jgi:hypothetical protein
VLPLKPYHFYLCGPTALLASLVPALEGWGVADERIHFEAFGPASIPRKKTDLTPTGPLAGSPVIGPLAVTFATSGKTCEWQPGMGSLLDFAEANGIEVASGCRSGSCWLPPPWVATTCCTASTWCGWGATWAFPARC